MYGCLDVSTIKNLRYLSCTNNQLNSLICNENLHTLYCYDNQLNSLIRNKNLYELYCNNNPLPSYYFKPLPQLRQHLLMIERKQIIEKILSE